MRALRTEDARSLKAIAYSKNGFAATDGKRILYFPEGGGKSSEIVALPASRDDIEIRALSWIEKKIYYYSGGRIWYTDSEGRERGDALRGARFPAPYGRFYDVVLVPSGTELAVVAGIAGGYNLGIADTRTRDIRVRKMAVATRRILFVNDQVQVVRGGSGSWKLVKISLPSENAEVLKTFHSLSDIVLFDEGYIYRDRDLHLVTGETDITIPFNLEILGNDKDLLFCRFKGSICLVGADRVRRAVVMLQEIMPDYPGFQ